MRRFALVLFLAAMLAAPAAAQTLERPWLDPEAVDVDEEAETHSSFWERTLTPNKEIYEARVKRAMMFLSRSDDQSQLEAERILRGAIELAPDQPAALWLLSHLYHQMGKFDDCAQLRAKVATLDNEYVPPTVRGAVHDVDFGLGICLSLSGKYKQALTHYKKMLARGGFAAANSSAVRWRMGEAYMALGRLDDAIAALEQAKRRGKLDTVIYYALAAAYDRDEQLAKARETIGQALSRDPSQSQLARPGLHIAPPEDVHYYIALALMIRPPRSHGRSRSRTPAVATRSHPAQAIVKFRRFLAEHGKAGPWARRARQHIADLSAEPISARSILPSGDASIDLPKARAAIEKAHPELQRCVAKTPGVVYRVDIIIVDRRRGRRNSEFGGQPAEPGVRAQPYEELETEAQLVTEALDCLEQTASKLALPKPKGSAGSHVRIQFPVVAQ